MYHQGPRHSTDDCYSLKHAIQDLIDRGDIVPPSRPNVITNPLPNHDRGKGLRIKFLSFKEEKGYPIELVQNILTCTMLAWEELMDIVPYSMKSKCDIWEDDEESKTPSPQKVAYITRGGGRGETLQTPTS